MKIIKSKKYANTFEGYNPFKVDFAHEEEKAKQMDTESLFGALKDAIEASQVSVNEGKYYDQVSVYRKELLSRGISFEKQDEKLKGMSSLHTNRLDSVKKTHEIWKDAPDNVVKEIIQDDRHMA